MPRILLVDDDHAVQETLAEGLRTAGYEVETCRDGRAVVPTLEKSPFDLLLLDVLIPHLNGFGVLEAVRAHPKLKTLKVVLISGIYRRRNHRATMLQQFGVSEYLDKPVSIAELRELVASLTGRAPAPITLDNPKRVVTLTNVKGGASDKGGDGGRRGTETSGGRDAPSAPSDRPAMRPRAKTDTRLVEPAAQDERAQVEEDSRDKFRTQPFLLQGLLRERPVAALLGTLWQSKRSGGLLLRSGEVKKIVYLQGGAAYAVKSNLVSECLGRLLVRERLISEEECAASIQRMKESGRRQGEILVEMRSMTDKNLKFALELQLEAKLFDTFKWDEGEFRFNPSVDGPAPGARLEWQGPAVVSEGIRRAYDETRLRGLMLPLLEKPLTARPGPPIDYHALGLSNPEAEAAAHAALPSSTRELLDGMGLEPPDALRVIYTLIALELWETKR